MEIEWGKCAQNCDKSAVYNQEYYLLEVNASIYREQLKHSKLMLYKQPTEFLKCIFV